MKLNEESEEFKAIKQAWREEAKTMTLDNLPIFLDKLAKSYTHDYGTICHAMTFAAIAALWAMNNTEQGGIAGFQSGCIMWGLITEWSKSDNECGLRLVDYDNFLYPQYDYQYQKTLSPSTWEKIQEKARENLRDENPGLIHPDVLQHWANIVNGIIPFGYKLEENQNGSN